MASNKATTLKIKNNAGTYTALYPKTAKSRVLGWNIGEIKGPYILTLEASKWVDNRQVVDLLGVGEDDLVECVKILKGTKEEMDAQDKAYSQIRLLGGLQPLNNKILFVCKETPVTDFQVQVWWTK